MLILNFFITLKLFLPVELESPPLSNNGGRICYGKQYVQTCNVCTYLAFETDIRLNIFVPPIGPDVPDAPCTSSPSLFTLALLPKPATWTPSRLLRRLRTGQDTYTCIQLLAISPDLVGQRQVPKSTYAHSLAVEPRAPRPEYIVHALLLSSSHCLDVNSPLRKSRIISPVIQWRINETSTCGQPPQPRSLKDREPLCTTRWFCSHRCLGGPFEQRALYYASAPPSLLP
jgi:hypothetical protein